MFSTLQLKQSVLDPAEQERHSLLHWEQNLFILSDSYEPNGQDEEQVFVIE